jgi:hypothetical protein
MNIDVPSLCWALSLLALVVVDRRSARAADDFQVTRDPAGALASLAAECVRHGGTTMNDQALYVGFIRLHILHHAVEEPIFGLGIIEELPALKDTSYILTFHREGIFPRHG